jgi:HEPN domain-containing protein
MKSSTSPEIGLIGDLSLHQLALLATITLKFGSTETCFLAQQCIEKSMKAYLLNRSNTYPRTHKLVDLLGECENLEPAFSQFQSDCLIIDQYYIPTRYPNGIPGGLPEGTPGQTEARESVEAAERVLQFVMKRVHQ